MNYISKALGGAAFILVSSAMSVSAATCTVTLNPGPPVAAGKAKKPADAPKSVTYTVTQGDPDTATLAQCGEGNDLGGSPIWENFGGLSYTKVFELNSDDEEEEGEENEFLTFSTLSGPPVLQLFPDGTYLITLADMYKNVILAFKQSTSYGGFLLDGTKPLSGTWGIMGPSESEDVFSHVTVWVNGEMPPPPPAPVPLPASALLLIAGLGGLAAVRRRKA